MSELLIINNNIWEKQKSIPVLVFGEQQKYSALL